MFVLTTDRCPLQPDQKVLKAADYRRFLEADALIAEASQEAKRIRSEASEAAVEAEKRGYEDGLIEGKMQMAEQMIDNVSATVNYLANVEVRMVELVINAVRKIVGEIDDRQRILGVVRQVLTVARNEKRVILRVCRSEVDTIKSQMDELLRANSSITFIDVVADPRLTPGDCILETEVGVVEATLDAQVEALRASLLKHLAQE